ncbi:MAG: DNA repair protein RecO [Desulfovibrionaceae bacterium]|nr:DNA repair protein RecO [Desulfovibrionaceae bacterium]
MNNFTEPLCILKTRLFREHDISLHALSKERGFLTVYAFGGAKSRRRFIGCLDKFTIALCTVQKSMKRGYLTLQEASLIASSKEFLHDTMKYGVVQNCALFLQVACRAWSYTSGVYTLFYDLLQACSDREDILFAIPFFFRFSLVALLGYTPSLYSCVVCSRHIDTIALPFFSIEKGGVLCHSCSPLSSALRIRDKEILYVLQYILSFSPIYWKSIPYNKQSIQQACTLIDEYVQYHLGVVWDNGRFIHV